MAMFAIAQAIYDLPIHTVQGLGTLGWSESLTAQINVGTIHLQVSDWVVLAQQFDTDPFAGFREWFSNLLETGQLWALLIGFIIGYLFRGFTSYG